MRLFNIIKNKERIEDVPGNEKPVFSENSGAGNAPRSGEEYEEPKAAPPMKGEEPEEPEQEQPTAENGQQAGDDYDLDGHFSEFYDRLKNRLASYGITGIPSFDELYGLLESFLRPSIDEAIAARNRTARANMAELDADAYARGMGSSSFLTSVKSRELDRAASDAAALEGKYSQTIGEYLYKALSAMQSMENEMAKLRLSASGRSGRSSGSSGASAEETSEGSDPRVNSGYGYKPYGHTKNGAYFDGVWYDGDFSYYEREYTYADYARYLKGLSPSERYLFFTSDAKEWRTKRWQVQYNLPQVDYLDLMARFMNTTASGGGIYFAETR